MKFKINGFNILDHNQWVAENMYVKVALALVILYLAYVLLLYLITYISNSYKKVSYLELVFDQKESKETHITNLECINSLHEITKRQKLIIHLVYSKGNTRVIVGTQNKHTLLTLKYFFKSQFHIECKEVTISNTKPMFYSEFKLGNQTYPIRSDEVNFFTTVSKTIEASKEDITISYLLYSHSRKSKSLNRQSKQALEGRLNAKGIRYVPIQSKIQAEQLQAKIQYPLFQTRLVIQTESFQTLKTVRSLFHSLQTLHNDVFFGRIKRKSSQKPIEWMRTPIWFQAIYLLPHIYLNTKEVALLMPILSIKKSIELQQRKTPQNEMFRVG